MNNTYSIIIPAYNEEGVIGKVLADILQALPKEKCEVIVVNDCSSDDTAKESGGHPVTLLSNVQNFGYGYSLKRGITAAAHDHIVILDADGSYPVSSIKALIEEYEKGFDMVVGARTGVHYGGSQVKRIARFFFRALSEFATGRKIPDINSGCRVFRKDVALSFFHTLSTGFSFTTTITLAFMLNAYSVRYLPIAYHKRVGNSKVRYIRDTLRSAQIILESIAFYNPLKIFLPCAVLVFVAGIVAAAIALYSPVLALLFFFAVAVPVLIMALGFIAVLIRLMGTAR